jgi:hypothetical protein
VPPLTTFCLGRDSNEVFSTDFVLYNVVYFVMRHILLGIAAIAAAQIAFQLLVVDDYAPEYSSSIARGAWPVDTIVAVRGDVEPPIAASLPVPASRPGAARVTYRKLVKRRFVPVRAARRTVANRRKRGRQTVDRQGPAYHQKALFLA